MQVAKLIPETKHTFKLEAVVEENSEQYDDLTKLLEKWSSDTHTYTFSWERKVTPVFSEKGNCLG